MASQNLEIEAAYFSSHKLHVTRDVSFDLQSSSLLIFPGQKSRSFLLFRYRDQGRRRSEISKVWVFYHYPPNL
ncbi:unnamed protein product [Cochlearia groenlandica]